MYTGIYTYREVEDMYREIFTEIYLPRYMYREIRFTEVYLQRGIYRERCTERYIQRYIYTEVYTGRNMQIDTPWSVSKTTLEYSIRSPPPPIPAHCANMIF